MKLQYQQPALQVVEVKPLNPLMGVSQTGQGGEGEFDVKEIVMPMDLGIPSLPGVPSLTGNSVLDDLLTQ